MDKQQLLSNLQDLHDELARADHVDAETVELLRSVTDEITELASSKPEGVRQSKEPVNNQLQELLLKFEADHPHLVAAFQRITTGLANLGI
jgi:predicted  nucleic acid-binding Zn-ribbon protein